MFSRALSGLGNVRKSIAAHSVAKRVLCVTLIFLMSVVMLMTT